MLRSILILFLFVIASCTNISSANKSEHHASDSQPSNQAGLDGVEELRTIEGITEYRLSNGLQVLLFPDPSQETITVNITYRVGSKHENYGETGMAHLLEHLVFKGTPRHKDIPKELTDHGAEPNGTTWTDRTNYFETFSANDENLNWALDLEADRMVNSFIAKKDLDSEMTVVRNELENGENSPFRVLIQRMLAASFDWHNYGKSTIGARSDLENVKIENLKAFYKKYYLAGGLLAYCKPTLRHSRLIQICAKVTIERHMMICVSKNGNQFIL